MIEKIISNAPGPPDSISSNSWIFDAQRDLALLSRVNEAFYTICHDRLYLDPILGNGRMVKKWIRNYSSLVNPWSICEGTQSLESVVVPNSIRFKVYRSPIEQLEDQEFSSWNRRPEFVDEFLPPINSFALSAFFFRDLTSIIVSPEFPFPRDFIISVCGPFGVNRKTLTQLSLGADASIWLNSFLLEAYSRMLDLWDLWATDYLKMLDVIAQDGRYPRDCNLITTRLVEEDRGHGLTDQECDRIERIARDLAPSNYRVLALMSVATLSHEVLPPILETRNMSCHPYHALQRLSLHVSVTFELYLIFHSRLFPVLRHLKLVGYFMGSLTLSHDVKLLRHSITERQGKIDPPDVAITHPNLFDSWDPLTKEEMESAPKIDYFGPNLDELDLSDCEIAEDW
ncbi:uncharacterized protein JCM6883_000018 [Sporobolomyces salmoneus]|uniref:uncharacterized protein n=1 Tax=Sporobolomyces salmoneus TaxID=183962 RepID=UPI003174920D